MYKLKLDSDGSIAIPAEYRKALGLEPGDTVILSLEDGELRLRTIQRVIQRAQEWVRRLNPEGVSLSDELIRERRREAASE